MDVYLSLETPKMFEGDIGDTACIGQLVDGLIINLIINIIIISNIKVHLCIN